MAFYTLGTTPLVNKLQITSPEVREMCLADDISGVDSLGNLIIWWKNIISECKKFGYLVNEKLARFKRAAAGAIRFYCSISRLSTLLSLVT